MELNALRVAVKAGYRLHLGFYRYLDGDMAYGSIGLALEDPYLELRMALNKDSSERLDIKTPTEESTEAVLRIARYLGLVGGSLELSGFVRHHVGLGSITRIYLATALAASMALRRPDLDFEDMLTKLGRCRYSCVGYYTFIYGGLAVDTGVQLLRDGIPRPLSLVRFPRSWYIVLAIPEGRGLKESEEDPYMRNPTLVAEQKDLYKALADVLTGVKLERIDAFVRGIETIQSIAGKYFSQAQGGVFSSPYGDVIYEAMRKAGLRGIGQSSWGPAIYGFSNDYFIAESARRRILDSFDRLGVRCDVWVSRASELGYSVYVTGVRS